MAKVSTSISIDADLKKQAQELFDYLGLDMSTAVTLFLRQAVQRNGLPFEVSREVPNAETIAAMKEGEEMRKHPERYKRYQSFDEALADILKEDDSENDLLDKAANDA